MKLTVEGVAALCHAVNKAYCEAIGDASQQAWNEAPKWQRESAIEGVKFRMKFPDASPDRSHTNWMAQKVAEGWRHGAVKDPVAKTHPCMVPFEELPPEQRAKDWLFASVVASLAANDMVQGVE